MNNIEQFWKWILGGIEYGVTALAVELVVSMSGKREAGITKLLSRGALAIISAIIGGQYFNVELGYSKTASHGLIGLSSFIGATIVLDTLSSFFKIWLKKFDPNAPKDQTNNDQ